MTRTAHKIEDLAKETLVEIVKQNEQIMRIDDKLNEI